MSDLGTAVREPAHRRPARSERAAALGALATGALALGAMAVGALAVGRLAIGALAVKRGHARTVVLDDLTVGRLRVRELIVEGERQRHPFESA